MALTKETITANETLAGLTEEQITAVTTLSSNDENTVIGAKIGEVHGSYDKDVLEVTGVTKEQGEKTYDYVKRVLGDYKSQVGSLPELQGKITDYQTKVADFEKKIADGNTDPLLAQKLKDTEGQLGQIKSAYDADKQAWQQKESDFSNKITGIKVNSEFGKATSDIKFKASIPSSVQDTLLKSAQEGILSKYKADWVEGKMIFRDANGEIVRNPSNLSEPFTASELINDQLKDAIDTGKNATGAGTGNSDANGDVTIIDVSSAKSQIEAEEIISKYLIQKGVVRTSAEFAKEKTEIWQKANISKLPMR